MANLLTSWTDDDGSGTVGTIINNSQLQAIYQNTGHADNHVCQGRLTLQTSTPVTVNDVTGATTLYFTPYCGDVIALFDGSNWTPVSFSELSVPVPASTSQMYDVFVYNNAGVATLELLAWTNDTTRATPVSQFQNGVLVKSGAFTRRYVGSFRTGTISGQTESSLVRRYVQNYYNRVRLPLQRYESTGSWTVPGSNRQANASASNQVEVVQGIAEATLDIALNVPTFNTGTANNFAGIGEDSTTVYLINGAVGFSTGNVQTATISCRLSKVPAIGRHVYAWMESASGGTVTMYGTTFGTSGLSGWFEG